MKRSAGWAGLALLAIAARAQSPVAAPSPPAAPASATEPSRLERWSWNPRERTATGIARQRAGDAAGAASALDVAFRLAPAEPTNAFNAGTARLGAGRPDAIPALERAAHDADAALAPDAYYNLGNARLAAHDARGAIDAYVETLRRASDRTDAKHNLELALRELERQQQQQQQEQQQQDQQEQQEQQPTEQDPKQQPGQQPDPSSSAAKSQEPEGQQPEPQPNPAGEGREPQPRPEPGKGDPSPAPPPPSGFRDVPEMNAEQAAALLAAVENLERQARRERSAARARERAAVDDDW